MYGGSTIKNFIYGIRAWHLVHGAQWNIDDNQLQTLLTAGRKLTPSESKKAEKIPWTVNHLSDICKHLNPADPKDAAILACLTTAFWGATRLGEVTVPTLDSFDPRIHVKFSDLQACVVDRNNLEETVIFLPWTKASKEKGEKIFWAKQHGATDPQSALTNHLNVNNPPDHAHLFAYKHENGFRPLSRNILITRINRIAKAHNLRTLSPHGIRVGATLEYLLRGVPFDVVKAKGRWQSEAFKGYLREHAQIMAPYMQADPNAYEAFIRYAMPPVR